MQARNHIALVYDNPSDPQSPILGVVTLEDVIEQIILAEIYDEADVPPSHIHSMNLT
jgi:CBS domain containing-hemolysin-like protein